MSIADPTQASESVPGIDVAGTLAWLQQLNLSEHPAVERRARWLLLDTLACITAGFDYAEPASYARRLASHMPGSVLWPGIDATLAPAPAAAAATMAACWHEACEGLARAHGRPGLHAVPVAAALGVQRGASLHEVLEAIVWGYEIGGRAGEAMRIRPGLHVDGTWGTLASVAAAARMLGLDAGQCLEAMATAACQLPVSLYAPVRAGKSARNTYAAHAASQGIFLAEAVAAGVRAPLDVFEEAALQLGTGSVPAGGWAWCPPGEFLILQGYLKPYAAVRHTHYAASAACQWHATHAGQAGRVRRVVLTTYAEAVTYCGLRAPSVPIQAQFSLSYATAHALLHGSLGTSAYAPSVLGDPALRRLEALVELRTDERAVRSATLQVETDAGATVFTVDSVLGDADQPFDDTSVREKALAYLTTRLNTEDALRLIEHVLSAPLGSRFELGVGGAGR
jgi:2-methylcitrate dehydratase PrpD